MAQGGVQSATVMQGLSILEISEDFAFTEHLYTVSLVVTADNLVIDGAGLVWDLYIIAARKGIGINLTGRSNVTITNLKINYWFTGILLNSSSHIKIIGNTFTNNNFSIKIVNSSNNMISGNNYDLNDNTCIELVNSSHNHISDNTITRNNPNSDGMNGVYLSQSFFP